MPMDELAMALADLDRQDARLEKMTLLHHDPARFLRALACANTARAIYAGELNHVDR